MTAKEAAQVATLQRMVVEAIPRASNSIQQYQLEGMGLALKLVALMASDAGAFVAEKDRLFGAMIDAAD